MKVEFLTILKKLACCIALAIGSYSASYGQEYAAAGTQRTNLAVGDIIAIGLVNSSGDFITMFFPEQKDLVNGLETPKQNLVVKSNQHFKVTLTTTTGAFKYNGVGNPQNAVPLDGIIKVKVEDNQTGGQALTDYNAVSLYPVTLISNGTYGDNQAFTVRFKATPGLQLPSGVYEVNVVYTATSM